MSISILEYSAFYYKLKSYNCKIIIYNIFLVLCICFIEKYCLRETGKITQNAEGYIIELPF